MSCEYTSTLYCHLMSFPAQKMTSNLRIILTLFDVAALNCVRSSGLLIAVHFITANSNREIQFIARVESLISHQEVLFSNFELKGARFLNGIFPHWGWARSRSLFSFLPLPEPGGETRDLSPRRDGDYKYNAGLQTPGSITNPALAKSTSGFLHEWREYRSAWGKSE